MSIMEPLITELETNEQVEITGGIVAKPPSAIANYLYGTDPPAGVSIWGGPDGPPPEKIGDGKGSN